MAKKRIPQASYRGRKFREDKLGKLVDEAVRTKNRPSQAQIRAAVDDAVASGKIRRFPPSRNSGPDIRSRHRSY